ncbi:MAG TPA: rhodanese-like domain-containing protein [Candidatus Acidoferrales bacterium]|nr:rhodanese-like domain-containing protein [Candidatus Acidoferrales bacterium]
MFERLMGLKAISPAELHERMQHEALAIIDVNARQSWLAARVTGARHLDPVGYNESDLPTARDAALVFYCSNFLCRKAPNAARRAKGMGYSNVYVMSAGISGWLGASLPTESGEVVAKRETVSVAGA